MDRSLIDRQTDEILEAEGFEDDERFECTCGELYDRMAESPEGMLPPEHYGIGNIPVCDGCKASAADTRAELEGYR